MPNNANQELKGRVALVTGASRNIGRAIALELAGAGASVVVVTKSDAAAARNVVAEIEALGGRAVTVVADIADLEAIKRMVAEAIAAFGHLDIVVNNAGVRPESKIEDMTYAEWRQVFSVVLDAPFFTIQAALPHLAKSDAAAIVNIGGLTAYTGAAHRAHVVSAKAGLDGLTKALALELAPKGITVNLVSPGLIDTVRGGHSTLAPDHHKKHASLVLGRRGRPEEVAAMIRHLVGPNGRYLTGQTIHVNGGAYLP